MGWQHGEERKERLEWIPFHWCVSASSCIGNQIPRPPPNTSELSFWPLFRFRTQHGTRNLATPTTRHCASEVRFACPSLYLWSKVGYATWGMYRSLLHIPREAPSFPEWVDQRGTWFTHFEASPCGASFLRILFFELGKPYWFWDLTCFVTGSPERRGRDSAK